MKSLACVGVVAASITVWIAASAFAVAASAQTAAPAVAQKAAINPNSEMVRTVGEAQPEARVSDVVHPAAHPDRTYLGPAQIRHFYEMDDVANQGQGQTIALIGAHHDPTLDHDLQVFSQRFGLPLCTVASGCLRQIEGPWRGAPEPPPSAREADSDPAHPRSFGEVSMDVEWAHAIAPHAHLLVVEAPRGTWDNYLGAVDAAVQAGATVVSLSLAEPQRADHKEMYLKGNAHFLRDEAVYVAAAGDHAHTARWPASSPDVVGVGGTTIFTDDHGTRLGETAWKARPVGKRTIGTGGGLSLAETEPQAQIIYGIPNDPEKMRGTPDVAYYASARTEIAIYNSNPSPRTGESGWHATGGTSAGAPQWAGLLAIANSMRAALGKSSLARYKGAGGEHGTLAALYTVAKTTPAAFHDITEGSNGDCGAECNAGRGYDYLTGLGSPDGAVLLQALAALP